MREGGEQMSPPDWFSIVGIVWMIFVSLNALSSELLLQPVASNFVPVCEHLCFDGHFHLVLVHLKLLVRAWTNFILCLLRAPRA